jgi:diadenosine tetraphosphatase ApaH/serine/threonine PP2A family protein phosphatase
MVKKATSLKPPPAKAKPVFPAPKKPIIGKTIPTKTAPPVKATPAKAKDQKAEVPTMWQTSAAGLHISHTKGPGTKALDAYCEHHGLSYGIVSTLQRGESRDETHVIVLIGEVHVGKAKSMHDQGSLKVWDDVDVALGQIAKNLGGGPK